MGLAASSGRERFHLRARDIPKLALLVHVAQLKNLGIPARGFNCGFKRFQDLAAFWASAFRRVTVPARVRIPVGWNVLVRHSAIGSAAWTVADNLLTHCPQAVNSQFSQPLAAHAHALLSLRHGPVAIPARIAARFSDVRLATKGAGVAHGYALVSNRQILAQSAAAAAAKGRLPL